MVILGLNAFHVDTSAALMVDGRLLRRRRIASTASNILLDFLRKP